MNCPCNDSSKTAHTDALCVNLQILAAKGWTGFVKNPADHRTSWKRGKWLGCRPDHHSLQVVYDELNPANCWRMLEELCERFGDLAIGKERVFSTMHFTSRNERRYDTYAAAVGATWLELIGASDDE